MDDCDLRTLIREVAGGRLCRRHFVGTLVGLGLTAPLATEILAAPGVSPETPARDTFTPSHRGGGGALRLLWWQAPTLLNPQLAGALPDWDGARLFYEPLASYAPDGTLVPVLAAEIPTVENGGVARDGTWVVWRLKRDVAWHDGRPFTGADVVFNWEYGTDLTATSASYIAVERVETWGEHAVRVVFKQPTPFWSAWFCGRTGQLIPKHLFEAYRGSRARDAPANLRPVGTGPYRCLEFRPGDVIRAELNSRYHVPLRPFFDTVEFKGGGDAVSAARAVLQTGDYNVAGNLQIDDELLSRLEHGGKGRVLLRPGSLIEHILCNQADPWTGVDGERASARPSHPVLTDAAVRSALSLLVDREAIQRHLYGRLGRITPNILNFPGYQSPNIRWAFDVSRANEILDAAGWRRGADGIRARDGKRLSLVFQTSA